MNIVGYVKNVLKILKLFSTGNLLNKRLRLSMMPITLLPNANKVTSEFDFRGERMADLYQISFHDSIIKNISIRPENRSVVIELYHLTDQVIEKDEVPHEAKYCQAILALLDYKRIDFDVKGDINKEIVLTTNVTMGNNSKEGLIHLNLYTTSDSTISIYCNDYSFEEIDS